jgi:hypothetical protein
MLAIILTLFQPALFSPPIVSPDERVYRLLLLTSQLSQQLLEKSVTLLLRLQFLSRLAGTQCREVQGPNRLARQLLQVAFHPIEFP